MVEIGALVATIKSTVELARSAKDVNDQAQVNAAISDIMERLMAVQSELFNKQLENQSLLEEVKQLKAQIENDQRFDQYRLERTQLGAYIMPLKDECVTPDRVAHAICPHCRESGRLSVLSSDEHFYRCDSCKYTAQHTNIDLSGHGQALC